MRKSFIKIPDKFVWNFFEIFLYKIQNLTCKIQYLSLIKVVKQYKIHMISKFKICRIIFYNDILI
jgi:hypothetical protein